MHKAFLLLIGVLFCVPAKAQRANTYKDGYYYTNSGQKISGLISFNPYEDRIHFKSNESAKSEKIVITDIKTMIISGPEADSLIVLSEDNKENKKYFAKFIVGTPTRRFYYKFHMHISGGGPTMTIGGAADNSSQGYHNTYTWSNPSGYSNTVKYLMYQDGDTTYELTKKNYIEILSNAFTDIPDFLHEVQSKGFKFKNVDGMLSRYNDSINAKSN